MPCFTALFTSLSIWLSNESYWCATFSISLAFTNSWYASYTSTTIFSRASSCAWVAIFTPSSPILLAVEIFPPVYTGCSNKILAASKFLALNSISGFRDCMVRANLFEISLRRASFTKSGNVCCICCPTRLPRGVAMSIIALALCVLYTSDALRLMLGK